MHQIALLVDIQPVQGLFEGIEDKDCIGGRKPPSVGKLLPVVEHDGPESHELGQGRQFLGDVPRAEDKDGTLPAQWFDKEAFFAAPDHIGTALPLNPTATSPNQGGIQRSPEATHPFP